MPFTDKKLQIVIITAVFIALAAIGYFTYEKQKTTSLPQKEEGAIPPVKFELLNQEEKKEILTNLSSPESEKGFTPQAKKKMLKNLSAPKSENRGFTDEQKKETLKPLSP